MEKVRCLGGIWTSGCKQAYPSALGPSTSGGTFTTPRSRAALTASTSGPELVLSVSHLILSIGNGRRRSAKVKERVKVDAPRAGPKRGKTTEKEEK